MKKLLLITLTLASYFVNAQTKLTKFYNPESIQRSGFSYQITINVALIKNEKYGDRIEDTYSAELVQLKPTNNSYYSAKTKKSYSCDQLGNLCNPNLIYSLTMNIRYNCDGMESGATGYFKNLNAKKTFSLESRFINCRTPNFYDIIDSYIITCDPVCEGQISKRIDEIEAIQNKDIKNTQNTSTTNSNISNSSNPIAKENKQTSSGMPANNSGNDPLANYNNNSAQNSSFEKGYQQGQQIVNVATDVIDLFSPTPAQLQRKAEVQRLTEERNARITKSCKTYLEAQMEIYLPAAQKGDENARMKLCHEFLSVATDQCLELFYLIPDHKSWLKQAAANKNFYAINYIGVASCFNGQYGFPIFGLTVDQGIAMMDESVNMGNTDAMLLLGIYYSRKKKSPFFGGADVIKSLHYFEKGAKMGNVDCLYSLGMIYRHNYVNEETNIKYKIEKDDIAAFNYFSKAIINRYNEDSPTIKSLRSSFGYCTVCSKILKKSYYELSLMYEKGIGCKVDKETAKRLFDEYEKL